jgi:hypothetical protein
MATAQYLSRGYVRGSLASTRIKTPETVMVKDPKANAEHLVVVHPCGSTKPVVTVSEGPELQQIISADGVPVAIVANGNALKATDIQVIECDAGGTMRL